VPVAVEIAGIQPASAAGVTHRTAQFSLSHVEEDLDFGRSRRQVEITVAVQVCKEQGIGRLTDRITERSCQRDGSWARIAGRSPLNGRIAATGFSHRDAETKGREGE